MIFFFLNHFISYLVFSKFRIYSSLKNRICHQNHLFLFKFKQCINFRSLSFPYSQLITKYPGHRIKISCRNATPSIFWARHQNGEKRGCKKWHVIRLREWHSWSRCYTKRQWTAHLFFFFFVNVYAYVCAYMRSRKILFRWLTAL